MRRREAIGAVGGAALAGLAGCGGLFETRSARAPPLPDDRPRAVYLPTHVEGMETVGTAADGPYRCALAYTYPHRFWLVTGTRREKVSIGRDDSVHLMPVVWDAETGIVPPDVNPQVRVTSGEETVAQFAPWPMLSQPMGFHFGDNVGLDGDGSYRVEVSVGAPSTRRTGSLAESRGRASFGFDFEFDRSNLEEIPYRDVPPEREGTEGALSPMETDMLPSTRLPAASDLPGTVRGRATSGDASLVVTTLSDAPRFDADSRTYLAVSPRTPHNRYVLPTMSLSATLTRDGDAVYDDVLRATIDPALGYHYGAAVDDVAAGDELTVVVDSPPQVARHEGYETAFLDMADATMTM